MLTGLSLFPLRRGQAGSCQLALGKWEVSELFEVDPIFPTDAPQFHRNRIGVSTAIIVTREIDRAAIEINPDWLGLSFITSQDLRQEIALLHLERAGKTRGHTEDFRIVPRQSEAANASHGRA